VVRVLGDADALERTLAEQPFVSQVALAGQSASFVFTGDDHAQRDLLRALIAKELPIVEFQGKTETLEDAFMAITKGVVQ
jgi:hypothetical protein